MEMVTVIGRYAGGGQWCKGIVELIDTISSERLTQLRGS